MKYSMVSVSACAAFITGCGSLAPAPLTHTEIVARAQSDHHVAQADVEPIKGPLSLEEAIARALKYNLERRTRMMEEAVALNQLDVSQYDMLPKLVASVGYHKRSEHATTRAVDSVTGSPSLANPFISNDRTHTVSDLGLTWSVLDFGLSYYGAQQNADRVLIASERRRKAMHVLIQNVRTAFWRAASAQKLLGEVERAIALAEEALADSRKAEEERLRPPLESMRFQRQLLENLRLLEAIEHDQATARVELSSLINAPLARELTVAEPTEGISKRMLDLPVERMEDVAIAQNADIREQFYKTRIARVETRRTLLKLFPNLSFDYSLNHDSDSHLVHDSWNKAGALLSFNLVNLFSAPAQQRLAEAGVTLSEQRRVATQMAVLAQVHVARLQYASAYQQFVRADAISEVDERINQQVSAREKAQSTSKLDKVANNTTAILSLLRRYQALAQLNVAASRLQATLGLEPRLMGVRDQSLAELTTSIALALRQWNQGSLPVLAEPAVGSYPTTGE
ncbi:MAG: TolC family protein [Burkholderiaceae bacterium]|nr:TolC family protein [Burkholderiaceae bacterium]MDH3460604.1 TolC family protein [Burkholderiaceae bacterium]